MPETWSFDEIVAAGWSEDDLAWERASETALESCAASDVAQAMEHAGKALRIARQVCADDDPRLGTSLLNFAACLGAGDPSVATGKLRQEGRAVWQHCDSWIARMTAPRMARSSLFHMRMEQRHSDAYRERWQVKWRELADEALDRVDGRLPVREPGEAIERWRRERPAMLNDTRKLMAAVILMIRP